MAAPVIKVTENPQFMAMNTASVAPMTDSAPFIPQAQGTRAECFAAISRMPAGSGIPISTPAGAISEDRQRDARSMARADGRADDRRQRDDAENRHADDAEEHELDAFGAAASSLMRRLMRLPMPVPSSTENSVTVSE